MAAGIVYLTQYVETSNGARAVSVPYYSDDGTLTGNLAPVVHPDAVGSGGPGGAAIDRELVVVLYTVKTAFSGASVGDSITMTQVIDVTATPSTVSTIWRNQTTVADLGSAPSAANLTLVGSTALTDAQLRASAVPVSGPATDAQMRAAPIPVSGPLTDTALRATAVPVSGPATDAQIRATPIPVSGPLTDAQLRASAVPVSGPLTDTALRATPVPVTAAATIADGGDIAQGAVATAAYTDTTGAASGTLIGIGKGMFVTTAAFSAKLPASLGAKIGASSLSVVPNTDTPFPAVGNVASGATDSGNPVKVGGVYNGTPPTLTTGQRGDLQIDNRGNLIVVPGSGVFRQAFSNLTVDAQSSGNVGGWSVSAGVVFNGTSFDRLKKPNLNMRLLSSAATTNALSVKASAGDVFRIRGNNTVASKRYLKFYNKASAPTVGTDVPVHTVVLPASAPFDLSLDSFYFSTGIAIAITGAAADADTTAIALGDIECLNISYTG